MDHHRIQSHVLVPTSDNPAPDSIELAVREHHGCGNFKLAAEVAVHAYGQEMFRFVRAQLVDIDQANEASAELWSEIWRALPGFQWRSSFRTWAYVLARRVVIRLTTRVRRGHELPLSNTQISQLEAQLRTSIWYLRDDARTWLAEIRANLLPDERALLFMRVDQNLSWQQTAEILLEREPNAQELAAVRKKFSRLTSRLREEARISGLLPTR
jgi:RNA polymerase sigma-70 factor (ECF subfamily)